MKTPKWVLIVFSMLLITLLIGACGNVAPVSSVEVTVTTPPPFTALPIPSVTTIPSATDTATPTFSLPISSAPDGLLMAYIFDGNLYFQDGGNPPLQLTYSGEDRRPSVQIQLDPTPTMLGEIWVSPDGNWITYFVHNQGLFLGNLQDGITQAYQFGLPHEWSPDSMHFIYDSDPLEADLSLASVNAPPVFIGKGGFIGWLDASRYLYIDNTYGYAIGEIGKEPIPILIGSTQPFIQPDFGTLIFNFQP
ncbi:MAG: hypothetical protein HUU11_02515 [Anaerolineales bacterium]|nr:hypothetical protein [Anaerolineales bacterium]NUQ83562.1 hypothetical protein [Anaerolineales bacterium]